MRYIIMDTEASGLNTATCEIYSFGAFMIDTFENGVLDFNSLKAVHEFFNTDVEVPAAASNVNGLTRAILEERSNGLFFEEKYQSIADYIYAPDAIVVGYNVDFDKEMVRNNLLRYGLKAPIWKGSMDVMQIQRDTVLAGTGYNGKKFIKLVKASDLVLRQRCGLSNEKLEKLFALFVNHAGLGNDYSHYHSALWDAFITMMIFNEILKSRIK